MGRLFTTIYLFLQKRKWLMWALLIISAVLFVVYGLKVQYEEDISKLLPAADKGSESSLAFSSIKVKDKIFIQICGRDEDLDPETLGWYMDDFVDSLLKRDESVGCIDGILCGIDDDLMINLLDYALDNVPEFVDTSCYCDFDQLLTSDAISRQMAENAELVYDDMTGSVSEMVGYDPAALRNVIMDSFLGTDNPDDLSEGLMSAGVGGFTMVDGHIFCLDKTVALAFLAPDFNSLNSKAGGKLVRMIEKEIKLFEKEHPDAKVLFHGNPVQSVFNARQIKKDLAATIGISVLIICLLIGYCFRNASTLPMLLAPVIYGAVFALAFVFWIKGGMSLMAIGLGALILGVALSYCLHIITHYKYVSDPVQVLQDEATPVWLGCLTTIGAFLGLLFTQSDLLKDFGIFASLSMVGTMIFALGFMPHFFRPQNNKVNVKAFAFLDRISDYPLDQKKWLLILITVICVVCLYTQKWVNFDSNLRNIGYNEPKILESQQLYAEKNNRGFTSMYFAAVAPTLDEALVHNKDVNRVLDSLKTAGSVEQISNMLSFFVTQDVAQERIDAWKAYWSADRLSQTKKLITTAARKEGLNPGMFDVFYTLAESDYEPESLYDAGVFPDELISNYIEETETGEFMAFTSALLRDDQKKAVSDAIAACPNAVVIDPFYYTSDMVEVLHNDFNVILGISMIFVFVVLLCSFRSVILSIVAFLPMGLSWFVVKGIMGIFGLEFNLINIIVATFIFGIGVDYSIFMMRGLLAKANGQNDKLLLYHKTAIFFSAVVLIIVTVSLLFATHPAISSIGISTLIGMVSTILITYTIQPFLFRQLMRLPFFRKRFGTKE